MVDVDPSVRYDRQVRLWGDEGQESIGETRVCVLGSDSAATEMLKSLILAGIKSFCIIDDVLIERYDTGQNFFLHMDDVGKPRAKITLDALMELNPSVSGECRLTSPSSLNKSDLSELAKFSVVVVVNQPERVELSFANALYDIGVPLITVRTYGLLGCVKVCIKEHTIANTHEENARADLRIDRPFDKLVTMVEEHDLDEMSVEKFRHTPYIILLFKALEIFKKKRNDSLAFPGNYQDRKEIKEILNLMRKVSEKTGSNESENMTEALNAVNRAFDRTKIPSDVQKIFDDEKCRLSNEPFWIICEAVRRFANENDNLLPLRGELPDMTSDSERYTRLAGMFLEKAQSDAKRVLELCRIVENERGVLDGRSISESMCKRFCRNVNFIGLHRGRKLDYVQELKKIVQIIENLPPQQGKEDLCEYDSPAKLIHGSVWLLLLRAVNRFQLEKGRYPGTNGVPCHIDAFDLQQRINSMVHSSTTSDKIEKVMSHIPSSAVSEICRYAAGELHVISAFIGGIAAQEVIKLATNQFVPINNTFVLDGHTQQSETFEL